MIKERFELDVCWSHASAAVVWRTRILNSAKALEHATIVVHTHDDSDNNVSRGLKLLEPDAVHV